MPPTKSIVTIFQPNDEYIANWLLNDILAMYPAGTWFDVRDYAGLKSLPYKVAADRSCQFDGLVIAWALCKQSSGWTGEVLAGRPVHDFKFWRVFPPQPLKDFCFTQPAYPENGRLVPLEMSPEGDIVALINWPQLRCFRCDNKADTLINGRPVCSSETHRRLAERDERT